MFTKIIIKMKPFEEHLEEVALSVVTEVDLTEDFDFRSDVIRSMEEAFLAVLEKYEYEMTEGEWAGWFD